LEEGYAKDIAMEEARSLDYDDRLAFTTKIHKDMKFV